MQAAQNRRPGKAVALPEELHPAVGEALAARGIERLYSHQARGAARRVGGPDDRHHGHRVGQVAVLPAADARRAQPRRQGARAVPVPVEGARAGPGALAARVRRGPRAPGDLRRRHAARAALGDPPARERRAHQPRHAARRDPAQPPRVGATSSPTSRSWSSTRRTSTAASSAPTSATCCGGCAGSPTPTAPTPRFVLASATIANPDELAERLTGLEDFTVDRRATARRGATARSRCGTRRSPTRSSPLRRSALAEAADLLAELVAGGARTIVFMKSRKAVELMAKFASSRSRTSGTGSSRSGSRPTAPATPPQQRREIEHRLVVGRAARRRLHRRARARHRHRLAGRRDLRHLPRHGRLAAPDVGPRRAPRPRARRLRGGRGRARPVLLPPPGRVPRPARGGRDPRPRERADPRRAHALRRARGAARRRRRRHLGAELAAHRRGAGLHGRSAPAPQRQLRPARHGRLPGRGRRRCARRAATTWRSSRRARASCSAPSTSRARTNTTHEGAIYLHGGRAYEVSALDLEQRRALVHPFSGDWYTQPKRETDTQIERLLDRRETMGVTLSFGTVVVTEQVLAYQKKRLSDHEAIDLVALDLPQTSFITQALWYELGPRTRLAGAAADGAARRAARRGALADRGAPAAGDVRPLGHRRALHQPAPADRRADDLHLRRPPRRHRHHPPRLPRVRGARRRRPPARLRVPVREGLPVLRAIAEVREPQRAAVQARRARS